MPPADVWERYAVEFTLAFGDSPSKIRAVRHAYVLGFDVELIATITGFPLWRVQQVLNGGNPRREVF